MTAAELAALHAQCFTVPRPWSAAEFAAFLASPHVVLLTAPQGFALGRVIADEAELLTIAVAPDERRRGTGRALLAALLTAVAERGAKTIFLEVSVENESAIALYRSAGFADSGRRKAYYRDADRAIDALVLQRPVGS